MTINYPIKMGEQTQNNGNYSQKMKGLLRVKVKLCKIHIQSYAYTIYTSTFPRRRVTGFIPDLHTTGDDPWPSRRVEHSRAPLRDAQCSCRWLHPSPNWLVPSQTESLFLCIFCLNFKVYQVCSWHYGISCCQKMPKHVDAVWAIHNWIIEQSNHLQSWSWPSDELMPDFLSSFFPTFLELLRVDTFNGALICARNIQKPAAVSCNSRNPHDCWSLHISWPITN